MLGRSEAYGRLGQAKNLASHQTDILYNFRPRNSLRAPAQTALKVLVKFFRVRKPEFTVIIFTVILAAS